MDDILKKVVNTYGYKAENITLSDIEIKTTEQFQKLYEKSNGSLSDRGFCLFYTKPFTNDKAKLKGTLHKVKGGVTLIPKVIPSL